MRRFQLHRDRDISHVSGTGVVAEGVEFSTGEVVLAWIVEPFRSTVLWPEGIRAVEHIHGHDGATRVVWIDDA